MSIRIPAAEPAIDESPGHGEDALDALIAAGDVVYIWDMERDQVRWAGASPEFARLGAAAALPDGKAWTDRLHPDDRRKRESRLDAHRATGQTYDCEYRLTAPDGEILWVHDRGAVTADGSMRGVWRFLDGRRGGPLAVRERRAGHDELTGLYDRRRLREAFEYVISASERSGRAGAYLAVGIDRLSDVNDSFGTAVGDTVLIEIGHRLELTLRASDVLGRVEADRFGIVLAECPEERAAIAAERILTIVNREPVLTAAGPVYATVSIGAAMFPHEGPVARDIMNRAEHALAKAKRAGSDCFIAYSLSAEQREKRRADMAVGEQVQRALKDRRLVFSYQPIVKTDGPPGAVDYHECLLRMLDEDGKPVAAAAFIPVIERLGFVRTIDRYVLERAVREAAIHPGVTLGFNISGLTATDWSWLRAATRLLRDQPDVARRLVVEITETAALSDIEECARFVEALRELGCRVAIDDFGVGFTSLRHLQLRAVDTVKIDAHFVHDLATKPENQIFLRHLVGLAQGMGFLTIAEGVENEHEAAILHREGVRLLQGYHFARPSLIPPWHEG
ncbi:MAG: putative bifunctional diguanylate cyclase/phosphodiesterase [Stellaceae bacterium]